MPESHIGEFSIRDPSARANGVDVDRSLLESSQSVALFDPKRPAQSPAESSEPPRDPGASGNASRRHRLHIILMVVGIATVAIGAGAFWLRGGRYAYTDDAYVQSAKIVVTTDVSGLVASVNVHEGQLVKLGDLLFQLELKPFQIALDNARGHLEETVQNVQSMKEDYQVLMNNVSAQEAQVALDQVIFDRQAALVKDDFASRATYDQARYTLELDRQKLESLKKQARSQLAKLGGDPDIAVSNHPLSRQAQAKVDEAQRELDHTSVRAPFDGIVTQVDSLQPGDYLVAQTAALTGAGAMALVATDHLWVDAEMKETDLTYVQPGNPVTVTVDTYPGQVWTGKVDAISPASGSEFSVLPAENSSGNFVKVVQRIPVRISIATPPGTPVLRAGMSAEVSIDTGHTRSLRDLF